MLGNTGVQQGKVGKTRVSVITGGFVARACNIVLCMWVSRCLHPFTRWQPSLKHGVQFLYLVSSLCWNHSTTLCWRFVVVIELHGSWLVHTSVCLWTFSHSGQVSVGFGEADYQETEGIGGRNITVQKHGNNTEDVVLTLMPLLFSELPGQETDGVDPAECKVHAVKLSKYYYGCLSYIVPCFVYDMAQKTIWIYWSRVTWQLSL